MTTSTNIKNLPADREYFTERGYSQSYPWVVVKRTAKTVTLAAVEVTPDPEWKAEVLPGGFVGHCVNQHEQTWIFSHIDMNHTKVIRNTKRGWRLRDVPFTEGRATHFYDYNF